MLQPMFGCHHGSSATASLVAAWRRRAHNRLPNSSYSPQRVHALAMSDTGLDLSSTGSPFFGKALKGAASAVAADLAFVLGGQRPRASKPADCAEGEIYAAPAQANITDETSEHKVPADLPAAVSFNAALVRARARV